MTLALGGGAAKGLAHVGVLRGLEEDGIEVAAIAGTSMGSIVGALFSRGMTAREMEGFFSAVDWSRLGRIMVRSPGGAAFSDLLRETIGEASIEELELPFAAVCCDLDSGDEVILRTGDLADSVRASSAIPGILSPVTVDGRTLVDGAMVTPVPATAAAHLADAPMMAVNVLRPPMPGRPTAWMMSGLFEGSAPAHVLERVDAMLKRHRVRLWHRKSDFPNRLEVMMRSFHIMQYNLSKPCAIDLHAVEPEVGEIGWFDFHRARDIMAEGYRAYRESMNECTPPIVAG